MRIPKKPIHMGTIEDTNSKAVYRTKTGVLIGSNYQKPLPLEEDKDMLMWQELLLDQTPRLQRIIKDALYVMVLIVVLFLCVIYIK